MPFGLDLGTTNSSIAWADEQGGVWSLSVKSGREPFDAVIRTMVFDPLGVPVIGELAMQERIVRSAPFLASFKPKLDKQRLRRDVLVPESGGVRYNPQSQSEESFVTHRRTMIDDEFRREEVVGAAACMLRRLLTSDEIDREGLASTSLPEPQRGVLSRFRRGANRGVVAAPTIPTPAVPSARLLSGLSRGAVADRDRLYIGIPVTFGPTARKRLLGALGGTGLFGASPHCYSQILATCRFVYEPLALASDVLALGMERVLIVDFGGGTLDLALLEIDSDSAGKRVKQLGLGGLPWAGNALDDAFCAALCAADPKLVRVLDDVERKSPYDRLRALGALTRAKIELSTSESTTLLLDEYQPTVTRQAFEAAIESRMDEVVREITVCLSRAALGPDEVTRVILTGGSSLIPRVQARIRASFPHLDDFAFDAQLAGDRNAERQALTGVSRGLARFAYIESFEGGAACNWDVWSPSTGRRVQAVLRGAPDVADPASVAPIRLSVRPNAPNTIALYGDLLRPAFGGALADVHVPAGVDEVDVRVACHRERFTPSFSVSIPGAIAPIALFDLEEGSLSPKDLAQFIEDDLEWLPIAVIDPECGVLVRPIEIGDYVCWRRQGVRQRGKVKRIRHVATGEHVQAMTGFDPEPYHFELSRERENGTIEPSVTVAGDWRPEDVYLS